MNWLPDGQIIFGLADGKVKKLRFGPKLGIKFSKTLGNLFEWLYWEETLNKR
jgi:hypothetical protein